MIVYVLIALLLFLNLLSIFNLLILLVATLFVTIYSRNVAYSKKQFKELEEDLDLERLVGGDFRPGQDFSFTR